jgi:hypothetical protein
MEYGADLEDLSDDVQPPRTIGDLAAIVSLFVSGATACSS